MPFWGWGVALVAIVVIAGFGRVDDDEVATAPPTATATAPVTSPVATTAVVDVPPSAVATAATAPTSGRPAALPPAAAAAIAHLASLDVADPDPSRAPYERDDYDQGGWDDADGDCLSTRHELLITYSVDEVVRDGCRVVAGRWVDPYDGSVYTDAADVSVDHVVALAEAHRAGAWRWDLDTKRRFTNDETPGHLLIVGEDVNQAKADSTPDRWMPPDRSAHCQYAVDWITTKHRWGLTVTDAEADALGAALATCSPATPLRRPAAAPVPAVVTTVATTTTTSTIVPAAGPGVVRIIACDRRAESVTIGNTGGTAVDLAGHVLHDEERNHETGLAGFGVLQPGQQLTILTGPEAEAREGAVVWKRQNVWNNDGDTAHLIDPSGTVATRPC